MKALFCTDGSEISFCALDNIAGYCQDINIDVLCVIDWHFYPMYMTYPEQDFINTYEEIADKVLEHAAGKIRDKGMRPGALKKAWGSASEEIIKHTKKHKYEIIILGSYGKKGIKNWIGSVSRQVVNHTKEPVFISKEKTNNQKVLFTADGSQGSKQAIKKALDILNFENKEIYTITVMEDASNLPLEITSNQTWFNDYLKKRNCFTENLLKETNEMLKQHNIRAMKNLSLIGSPASVITDTTEKLNIDLVILGSRSKDKISEFLLGSTSKRVLEKVKSSVLIISPEENDSD